MKKLLLFFFLLLSSSFLEGAFTQEIRAKMLYLIHGGQADKAFDLYLNHVKETKSHDLELLQQGASLLLEQGMQKGDKETQLMCIFGAGVSANPQLFHILEKGLHHREPQLQMAALNFLSKYDDDEAYDLLTQTLSSPFVLARLEAAFQLALKQDPHVIEHLQSLIVKIPPEAKALFPQIFAVIETPQATRILKQFIGDPNPQVRIETILSAAKHGKDELLPSIRSRATHTDAAEQEACIIALGQFQDETSLPYIRRVAKEKNDIVKLAALKSLLEFGDQQALFDIEKAAKEENIFALALLREDERMSSTLASFLTHSNPHLRLNAALGLLEQKNPLCLPFLREILIRDEKDWGFIKQLSPGKGLSAWRVLPHATQKVKMYPNIVAQTMAFRELVLQQTLELPEEVFLKIARVIFDSRQYDLIPLLVTLLENHASEASIQLLREYQQKAGAPLIRDYCNLALYKLKEQGPYEANLLRWVAEKQKTEMIRFKESSPSEWDSPYQLTPEETSQLLIDSFETLATLQNEIGIEALVEAIAHGNTKNRYALAGLLLRTTE